MRGFKYSLAATGLGWLLIANWCLSASPATGPSDPPPAPSARAVIEKVTSDAIAILRDAKLPRDEKVAKIKQIAYDNMDFQVLGRLSLGKYWRDLNDDQRAQFVQEFRKHVSSTYSHVIDDYTDEEVIITGDRAEEHGDWTVLTRISGKNSDGSPKEVAKVDYRLRTRDNGWKIIDVTIEGVSMAANFRSQFQEIMDNGGFDRLIQLLREKNAAGDK